MECDVTGQPKPNITWFLNGKQFTGDARISIKPNRLEFAVIYGGDIGVYQCIADNGREMVQSSAVLITAGMCARTSSSSLRSIGIMGNVVMRSVGVVTSHQRSTNVSVFELKKKKTKKVSKCTKVKITKEGG